MWSPASVVLVMLAGLFVLTVGGLVIAVLLGLWHARSRLPKRTDRAGGRAGDPSP